MRHSDTIQPVSGCNIHHVQKRVPPYPIFDRFAKFFYCCKKHKFQTKPVWVYLIMVEQKIPNIYTNNMVQFPTGNNQHCDWPVEKVFSGMCQCKWWTFWTPLWAKSCKQLAFLCVFGSSGFCSWCEILLCWCLMVDRTTLPNCKALSLLKTANEQKVKCWYFA